MKAFNNDPQLKADLLRIVAEHRENDQLVRKVYAEYDQEGIFHGCAVGCSIHSYNLLTGSDLDESTHSSYERFGIPERIALMQDYIFERLYPLGPRGALFFPEAFLKSINVGSELFSYNLCGKLYELRNDYNNNNNRYEYRDGFLSLLSSIK